MVMAVTDAATWVKTEWLRCRKAPQSQTMAMVVKDTTKWVTTRKNLRRTLVEELGDN